MIRALFVCAALHLFVGQADAHSWYDSECCNTQDCAPVEAHVIRATAKGWLVQIEPGDHPFATRRVQLVIPFDSKKARVSQDGAFHLCLSQSGRVLCIYVPVFGA